MASDLVMEQKKLFEPIGFEHPPFPVTPDAEHYFCSPTLEMHVHELMHCIEVRKGFMLFTADVGLGKSTLSRYLIAHLEPKQTDVALVLNTFLQGEALLRAINRDFEINADGDMADLLEHLNGFLLKQYQAGRNCLIMIDDAQNLSIESLEMLRLISNFEAHADKLVQILLIAQPEIMESINQPEIRQLKSRIALHLQLSPFDDLEVRDYVNFRLNSAGNQRGYAISTRAAKTLKRLSKGYPRQINLIMDRVLYLLLARPESGITSSNLRLAAEDLYRFQGQDPEQAQAVTERAASRQTRRQVFLVVTLGLLVSYVWWNPLSHDWQALAQKTTAYSTHVAQLLTNEPVTTEKTVKDIPQAEMQEALPLASTETTRPGKKEVKAEKAEVADDPRLRRFLKSFELDDYYTTVNQTLKTQGLEAAKKAFSATPLVLLVSSEPFPEQVVTYEYRVEEGEARHLTLWEPPYQFSQYYYGLKTESAGQLQTRLKQKGFYNDDVDQTVGRVTMYAVAQFQRSVGLKPTGHPDLLTLFYLEALS
ncbi:MAG: AAA family ATPase [Hydrogenovibrio sp.]|uniref:AAA family ATPase n=1 Tax=Hydrogenovibrio sp. TaxID=2065821 RepID=UPI00287083FE|nr:AAA family ATPase [Hydrogenovibrio sp.]MDR9497820.1 AAA family ATPase [Hydrogenovibrio sp.]